MSNKEIEVQFINIDKDEVIKKLKDLGALQLGQEVLLRRYTFLIPQGTKDEFVRVRDEGDGRITMTYKNYANRGPKGITEIELEVDDFLNAKDFLLALGLRLKAYQESKRLSFKLKDVRLDISTWPGLEPFLEIEAPSLQKLKHYVNLLGLDWSDAIFGGVSEIYARVYNVTEHWVNYECKTLKFNDLPPELSDDNKR